MFKVSIQLTNGIEYLTKRNTKEKDGKKLNPIHWFENVFEHPCLLGNIFQYTFSLKAHISHVSSTSFSIRMQLLIFQQITIHRNHCISLKKIHSSPLFLWLVNLKLKQQLLFYQTLLSIEINFLTCENWKKVSFLSCLFNNLNNQWKTNVGKNNMRKCCKRLYVLIWQHENASIIIIYVLYIFLEIFLFVSVCVCVWVNWHFKWIMKCMNICINIDIYAF